MANQQDLKKSVAGIRGIWGETLFLDAVISYMAAFGTWLKAGKVVIGRDTRTTGELLTAAATAALAATGCEVLDIGICPTPTCQLMVEEWQAAGGVVITASHNPGEWNGIKVVNARGQFLGEEELKEVFAIETGGQGVLAPFSGIKPVQRGASLNERAITAHRDRITAYVDADAIRRKGFKVALDACNGAGSRLLVPLLGHLGCTVVQLNCLENGLFPRGAEPTAENIGELAALVKKEKCHAGFAVDPDADRLSLVSEEGIALGEETTLPLVAQYLLPKKGGVAVTNLSTSLALDFVAKQCGTHVVRAKIGEAYVVKAMHDNTCFVGGEGNGGIIIPEIHYARDTGIGIGLILDYMAASGKPLSELAASIPRLVLVKKKLACPRDKVAAVLEHFRKAYAGEQVDNTDGVKIIRKDNSWLHIRVSGTEGALRIFTEDKTAAAAEELAKAALTQVQRIIGN